MRIAVWCLRKQAALFPGHFLAGSTPSGGIKQQRPRSGIPLQTVSANLTINGRWRAALPVGLAAVTFVMDLDFVYISTNPDGTTPASQSIKLFQVFVKDDLGQPINRAAAILCALKCCRTDQWWWNG